NGARFRMKKARPTFEASHDSLQAGSRQNRDAVPLGLTMRRQLVAARSELRAQQANQRPVAELGFLQAQDVRPPLIEPGQQSRHALFDGVDVPGGDPHRLRLAVEIVGDCLPAESSQAAVGWPSGTRYALLASDMRWGGKAWISHLKIGG